MNYTDSDYIYPIIFDKRLIEIESEYSVYKTFSRFKEDVAMRTNFEPEQPNDDPILLTINRVTKHGLVYIDFSEDLIVPPIWLGELGADSTNQVEYPWSG